MNNIYDETRFLMKKYDITANKSLGQNFLIDNEVIEDIVLASEITKNDLVIEIGPGLGTLTKELLEDRLNIQTITVMIQKEVADRIIAMPGSKLSGAITYGVNYYSDAESIRIVDRTKFIPVPNVDSEVIRLKVRKQPIVNVENEELFFNIIKCSFMQRRKTLINALVNADIIKNKEIAKKILQDLGIDENVRGEVLTIQDFGRLSNYIAKIDIIK